MPHTTTVTCVEAAPFGGGTYEIRCTCGETVRYSGEQFTAVEAERHEAWHAKQARREAAIAAALPADPFEGLS